MSQKNLAEKANSNFESDWVGSITSRFVRLPPPPGGGGRVLAYISHIGICRPKG